MAGYLGRGGRPLAPTAFSFRKTDMARFNRHRAYFVLLDIAFGLQLFMLSTELLDLVDIDVRSFGALFYLLVALAVIGLILPVFLIFARRWRDEFAEQLWQRAAGTTVKALVLLPLPATFLVTYQLRQPDLAGVSAWEAGVRVLVYLWLLAPLAFTFALQWHRWRASA